jgi:hypothetical protein
MLLEATSPYLSSYRRIMAGASVRSMQATPLPAARGGALMLLVQHPVLQPAVLPLRL